MKTHVLFCFIAYVFITGFGSKCYAALPNNANIASLTTSAGTPTAISATAYTQSVGSGISSITVTPTAGDPLATIKVNGTTVASGTASQSIALNVGSNVIGIIITAQNGTTTKNYTLTVTRAALPNNANIASLTTSAGTPTAISATAYTQSVGSGISSITVTPTAGDPLATIKVNGTTVASGTASQSIALNVGSNVIGIVITAQNGTTTKNYTLTVTRAALPNNANIASLTTSAGTPTAVSATAYTLSVGSGVSSLTVTPTAGDPLATIKVNGITVASGTASQSIALNVGSNVIGIVITAQNGTTTKTYTLTVTRAALPNNANIASLTTSAGTPTAISATAYTLSVANSIASLTVTPTAGDPLATIKVNGTTVVSGTASQSIALSVGSNVIGIIITAQNGTTTKSYTLTVTRAGLPSNAFILSLTTSAGTPTQVSTTAYTQSVGNAISSITVTPTAADPLATIKVNGTSVASGTASQSIALPVGPSAINIVITAQDGTTMMAYTLTVTRATPSNNAFLSSLITSAGTPAQVGLVAYTQSVSYGTASLTVTPTAADPNAVIQVNGTVVASGTASQSIALSVGSNVINIIVTAPDGVTNKAYTLTVTRASTPTGYVWTGNTNNLWSVATNWSPNGHPGAGDDIQIPSTANPPTVDVTSVCNSITITGITSITLAAPLSATSAININSSLTVSGSAGSITSPSLTLNTGASLLNSGSFNINTGNVTINSNSHIVNQSGGTFNINKSTVKFGSAGYINNASGGTFKINGGSTIDFATNSATNAYIYNAGTFYAGTLSSACTVNLNFTSNYIQNTGSFYLGSTSVVNLTGSGTSIQNTGTFTLQSDITGSAIIGNISDATGYLSGIFNVERYISGGSAAYRSYRLLSSPVNAGNGIYSLNYVALSSLITGTDGPAGGFDKAGNPTLYLYRDNIAPSGASFTAGNYRGIKNISAAPSYTIVGDAGSYNIPVANGFLFFFRGDRTSNVANKYSAGTVAESVVMTSAGTLNTGQIITKPWFTGSSNLDCTAVSGNSSVLGLNLVGNPYPSSIDWDQLNSTSSSTGIYAPSNTLTPFMYILDPLSKNYNVYQSGFGGASTNSDAANVISVGQGFFVQALTPAAQLIFNESAKINTQVSPANKNLFLGAPTLAGIKSLNAASSMQTTANTKQYLQLKIGQDSAYAEGAIINFSSNAKPEYDPKEDAQHLTGNGSAGLSSVSADGIKLSINSLPLPKQQSETVGLNVSASADGAYQLKLATVKSIPALFDIWLMDTFTKDSTNIRQKPTYNFDIAVANSASYGQKRFSLVIRQNPALVVHLLNFAASKTANGAQITWKTENEENYTYFTVERSVNNGSSFDVVGGFPSSAAGTYSLLDPNPPVASDQYRLKIEDLNGVITYSSVVILNYSSGPSTITNNYFSVYPNPAVNTINLSVNQNRVAAFNVQNKRISYNIQIINSSGKIIKTATSADPSWRGDVSQLLPGTYFINVVNNIDKSVAGKGSFIKQ